MGRLKAVQPRLGAAPSRLRQAPSTEKDRNLQRRADQPWRSLYGLARWQKLRYACLMRDGWKCQQTGVVLMGKYPAPTSPVGDHIIPAHVFWFDGRQHLFWDPDNIQSVSKAYHDSEKQRLEKSGRF
ncbi:endonuclease [Sedimentitalea sp. CY04]|uniref:Endonuclease n=1 Tax=Parasedimentitalea denitrificans TaxID=2211118 RepID=A0ABX0WEM0_9RHOB|nr:HNH endonuclease [Sedimentitalea sp. CY04]NIZ63298.1 endonuclease [Sedimentitalea sp. CY04]